MTRPLPGGDSRPWYRQFWPWFLILLPASVVVAGLTTAYIANKHADDLVVDDYYKDGLAINRQLEKKQRAGQLGISATLRFEGDEVTASTSGLVDEQSLQLRLSHPLEADRDFAVTLARIGPQLYRGTLGHAIAPHWHWILEAQSDSSWRLDGAVQAVDIGRAERD